MQEPSSNILTGIFLGVEGGGGIDWMMIDFFMPVVLKSF